MRNKQPLQFRAGYWAAGLFLVLSLATAGIYFFSKQDKPDQKTIDETTAVAALGAIEENVTAQGKLEPKEFVDVGAQVTGQLQTLLVEIGDNVTAGQLLAEIDPRIYDSRVQADEARIDSLEAQLVEQLAQIQFAERQYARYRKLFPTKGISQEALQNSEASYKSGVARAASIRAQLKVEQSTLAGDRTNLGYTKIYAPMDGTVVQQTARAGQTLNANQTTPTILQLAKLDIMTVRAQTAEADIMRIKPGLPVYFTTLGSEQRRWQGIVRQILPTPEVLNNVVLYNVLVDVDNSDRQLMSGMSAQVFFVLGRSENALLIPTTALGQRLPKEDNALGAAYRVKVMKGKETLDKTVYIGLQTRRLAEIRGGLAPGDRVKLALTPDKTTQRGYRTYPRL
ncbi:MAG: efflux RND transporter periplasmic adaptor subunit [Gammaproteobacteria bacterium]